MAIRMICVRPNWVFVGAEDGFSAHEDVLLNDLIPFSEQTYSAATDAAWRAIAALSMGGGMPFNYGFPHTDVFHYIGSFSTARNTRPPADNIMDVGTVKQNVRVFSISCCSEDVLINNNENYHDFLDDNGVSHVWQIE